MNPKFKFHTSQSFQELTTMNHKIQPSSILPQHIGWTGGNFSTAALTITARGFR